MKQIATVGRDRHSIITQGGPGKRTQDWPVYVLGIAGVAVAALLRWGLARTLGDVPTYFTFYPVVIIASLVGGTGPGVTTTILSALVTDVLFLESGSRLGFQTTGEIVGMGFFIGVSISISVLGGQLRKKSRELRENEQRLRQFIEQAPVAIAMFDREMRYLAASRRWLTNFSLTNQPLLGRSHYEVFPDIPERWKEAHRCCLQGAVQSSDEDLFERADGTRQWVRWEVQPWFTGRDLVGGIVIFTEDITERKRLQEHLEEEVHLRTEELREAIAELEQMSYSMVHDMRAPLRAISGYASVMQAKCADGREHSSSEFLERIYDSCNRLDRLITDALNYNKVVRETLSLTPVDLAKLLRSLVHTYPNLHPTVADIKIDLPAELLVQGNEALLTQCFGNLLDNAVKFVAPGVHPQIRVWSTLSMLDQKPSAVLYVADNGIGIPKDAQELVFPMFQRLHGENEYPGTGIGLAIVKKAVQRMGGRVGLESGAGRGTTFWVELPRSAEQANRELLKSAA